VWFAPGVLCISARFDLRSVQLAYDSTFAG
jgi:hypothetical protein